MIETKQTKSAHAMVCEFLAGGWTNIEFIFADRRDCCSLNLASTAKEFASWRWSRRETLFDPVTSEEPIYALKFRKSDDIPGFGSGQQMNG